MIFALEKGNLCPVRAFDGHIHSVFAKAINIVTDDLVAPWVSLLDVSVANMPCGLKVALLNQPLFLDCQVGDPVYCRGGIVRFGAQPLLSIDTRSAKLWVSPPKLLEYSVLQLMKNIRQAEIYLIKHINLKCQPILHINCYIDYLNKLSIPTNFNLFTQPELVASNIGKGFGLTPSGDDFICGVFALLHQVAHEQRASHSSCGEALMRLSQHCQDRWHSTTDVSRHYLQQASEGDFSQPVQWLVYSLLSSTSENDVENALNNVFEIGSSSGADIISGIIFCAHQLQLNEC